MRAHCLMSNHLIKKPCCREVAYLLDDGVRVVEEGDGDHGPRGDGQAQQEDGSMEVLLNIEAWIVSVCLCVRE